jgi:plasmid stabilization system protein ParE
MVVKLSRAALRDRDAAIDYYGERSTVAGRRFYQRLRDALRYIAKYPEGAPFVSGTVRAKIVIGFPYSVLYELRDGEILVAAIACHFRQPHPS